MTTTTSPILVRPRPTATRSEVLPGERLLVNYKEYVRETGRNDVFRFIENTGVADRNRVVIREELDPERAYKSPLDKPRWRATVALRDVRKQLRVPTPEAWAEYERRDAEVREAEAALLELKRARRVALEAAFDSGTPVARKALVERADASEVLK